MVIQQSFFVNPYEITIEWALGIDDLKVCLHILVVSGNYN